MAVLLVQPQCCDQPRPIPDDGGAFVELYNTQLEELAKANQGTWFTAPWLYAEYVSTLYIA